MVFVKKSLESMLNEIESTGIMKNDILIPAKNPDLFMEVKLYADKTSIKIPTDIYITSLNNLTGLGIIELVEIFSNAYERGNLKNDKLPIEVKVFDGLKGNVLRVKDSGKGFDYVDVIKKKRNGQKYFQRHGYGIGFLDDNKSYSVAYEGKGNIINVQKLNLVSDN